MDKRQAEVIHTHLMAAYADVTSVDHGGNGPQGRALKHLISAIYVACPELAVFGLHDPTLPGLGT